MKFVMPIKDDSSFMLRVLLLLFIYVPSQYSGFKLCDKRKRVDYKELRLQFFSNDLEAKCR